MTITRSTTNLLDSPRISIKYIMVYDFDIYAFNRFIFLFINHSIHCVLEEWILKSLHLCKPSVFCLLCNAISKHYCKLRSSPKEFNSIHPQITSLFSQIVVYAQMSWLKANVLYKTEGLYDMYFMINILKILNIIFITYVNKYSTLNLSHVSNYGLPTMIETIDWEIQK